MAVRSNIHNADDARRAAAQAETLARERLNSTNAAMALLLPIVRTVTPKTADYQITAADCGTLFTTTGATGDVTFTLPAAEVGLWYEFYCATSNNLIIARSGSDDIVEAGNTGNATASTTGSTATGKACRIVCVAAGVWSQQDLSGTWTVA